MKVQYAIYFNCNSAVVHIPDKKTERLTNDAYMHAISDVQKYYKIKKPNSEIGDIKLVLDNARAHSS